MWQVGIIPTDTLPALVADLENRDACLKLYRIKVGVGITQAQLKAEYSADQLSSMDLKPCSIRGASCYRSLIPRSLCQSCAGK